MMESAVSHMMALPREAEKRFEAGARLNQKLSACCEAQAVLLEEFESEIPDQDKLIEEMEKVDGELAKVSEELDLARKSLLELLNSVPQADVTEFVNIVFSMGIEGLQMAALDAVNSGQPVISVWDVLTVEDRIQNVIDDLQKEGMYPESEKAAEERIQKATEHMEKLAAFLADVVKEEPEKE
jgi:hypothetical protein